MDNQQTTTSGRTEVIEYLMSNYVHIFSLDGHGQEKVRINIQEMSDTELMHELDIVSEFRAKEKGIYQDVLISTIKSSEEVERIQEKVEVPVF